MEPILEIRNLSKCYRRGRRDTVEAVQDMSFQLAPGQCLGLVGESGCGKSTLCRLITGLERPDSGQLLFHQAPLTFREGRGRIQMVFQNSLDAVSLHMDAFHILSEPLENFFHMTRTECRKEAGRLMELVGLTASDLDKYPRQFSGGQLQRICIARALAAKPELLLLDEPLSSLDVSVQAQILNLLSDLKSELNLTYILISHDLEAVYYLSDAIIVMYGGTIMEQLEDIHDFPELRHPYTRRLLEAHGLDGADAERPGGISRLAACGQSAKNGCPYAPRCAAADRRCFSAMPSLSLAAPGHRIACHQEV